MYVTVNKTWYKFMQMCWLPRTSLSENQEKELHLRFSDAEPWQHYTAARFINIRQPDTVIPGIRCSKGFSIAQFLISKGFKVTPSPNV